MNTFPHLAIVLIVTLSLGVASSRGAQTVPVYLSSPADSGGGIYVSQLDTQTGELSPPVAASTQPTSFLALSPDKKFLYGCANIKEADGKQTGVVRAYEVADGDPTKLKLLNQQSSGGRGPCHVSLDRDAKNLFVANYGAGSFSVLPIDLDGKLRAPSVTIQHTGSGPNPKRQAEPHPHSVNLDPAGKIALVCDLGLDKIRLYKFDPVASTLTPADPPEATVAPGGGPRHLSFHPNGKWLYVDNEMGCSVTFFEYDGAGHLKEVQTVPTLPQHADTDTASEVHVDPTGKFLYCATRFANQMTAYSIDPASGKLTTVNTISSEGEIPRHFAVDPTGRCLLVANQKSGKVVVQKIDPASGALSSTGKSADIPTPMCVLFYR